MKAAKNTDVIEANASNIALLGNVNEFFDEDVVTDTNDILIPRILLMHGTSTLVGQQKATQGDIIDSVSTEVLANSKKTIEIIPIKQLDKAWSVERYNGKKFEFLRQDPWDESLSKAWEFTENGQKMRRSARLSFYVLLARDTKTNHLPYLISFQRTSYQAGRNIASFFSEALFAFKKGDKNSIPFSRIFNLGCHVETGDSGSYFVMDTKRTRTSTAEEIEKAKYWFTQLRKTTYQVDSEKKEAETEEFQGGSREF